MGLCPNLRQQRSRGRFRDTAALVRAHLAGDAAASEVWLESVRRLACAIASFVNAFDPERVILGGGIVEAGSALLGPLQRDLDRYEWRPDGSGVEVVPAVLGPLAGALGAAAAVLGEEDPVRD